MFNAQLKVPLQVGSFYCHKDHEGFVWKLEKRDEGSCHFSHIDIVTGKETALEVPAEDIASKVKVTKAKIGYVLTAPDLANAFLNITANVEHVKASLFMSLWEAYNQHDTDENYIKVVYQPAKGYIMYALQRIPKEELVFVPFTDQVAKISMNVPKTKEYGTLHVRNNAVYVLPPKNLKDGDLGFEGSFCPYFACKHKVENGIMKHLTLKHKDLQIVALHNSKAVEMNDEITLWMPPEELAPKSHAASSSKKRKTTA